MLRCILRGAVLLCLEIFGLVMVVSHHIKFVTMNEAIQRWLTILAKQKVVDYYHKKIKQEFGMDL